MSTFRRPSPATLIAMLALFVALAESSFVEPVRSAATRLVGGMQIKSNAVGGRHMRDNAVGTAEVRNGSLRAQDFDAGQLPQGPKGEAGPAGPQGAVGETGAIGPSGVISSAGLVGGPSIPNPDSTTRFLAPPATVTVPAGAKVFVSSHRAFGTSGATAGGLNLFMCSRIVGSGAAPKLYGNGLIGMQLPPSTKATMGFSHILENLPPGDYEVGLCGTGGSGWNNNDWGSTTALVLR
jgi:hypothetical protein